MLFPFSAVVGQDEMRLALVLNAIDPTIGGVLIRGEKGTAKSTIVRGLARHLPAGTMITLPLGITEDRVVGGLDLEATLRDGIGRVTPGILAEADGGILYVDEVNLLDDHVVDLVLDAAASGIVTVEREGFSLVSDARFALVGTMNPEEGELRPQLIDRFGLCVDVVGDQDPQVRVEVMTRRLQFDTDPAAYIAGYERAEHELSERIVKARSILPTIPITERAKDRAVRLASEALVAGHRAELVLVRAARALACHDGDAEVNEHHVDRVATMVLTHRIRTLPDRDDSPPPNRAPEQRSEPEPETEPEPQEAPDETHTGPEERGPEQSSGEDRVDEIGDIYQVRDLDIGAGHQSRIRSGSRQTIRSGDNRGRYISSRPTTEPFDLALDATLRAAAVHQLSRRERLADGDSRREMAVLIDRSDWRKRVRVRQTGSLVLLCVDASGSMGAQGRMVASKGAILSLLLDAYVKRDRVGLVTFRGREGQVLVEPTGSIQQAEAGLKELPVGGRTPLAAGMMTAFTSARRAMSQDPGLRPLIILVTDGRANVDLWGAVSREATSEAIAYAHLLSSEPRITWVVIDTERKGVMARGYSEAIAAALGAQYVPMSDLRADDLVNVVTSVQPELQGVL